MEDIDIEVVEIFEAKTVISTFPYYLKYTSDMKVNIERMILGTVHNRILTKAMTKAACPMAVSSSQLSKIP